MMRTRNLIALFLALIFPFIFLSCGGGGGGSSEPNDPGGNGSLPTASITANPGSIQAGQIATISWNTSGGTVNIPGIGSNLAATGSHDATPTATTTYTVTVTAPDSHVATASVTVNVTPVTNPPPTAAIQASVTNITQGQSVIISWQTSGGTASIPGIGSNLPASASQSVIPTATTTYTVTVTAPDSQVATASVTVNVTSVTVLWKNPEGYTPGFVTTDGNTVVRTGIKSNFPAANTAAIVCFNSDGTTRWTKEALSGIYRKGIIANGNLYVLREVTVLDEYGLPLNYDYYIDRRNLIDGALIGNPFYAGNNLEDSSIAFDSTGIFVSLVINQISSIVVKADLALSSKTTLLTFDGDINYIDASEGFLRIAGKVRTADPLGGTSSFVMVYTTGGSPVWANPQVYTPQAGIYTMANAVASSGGYVYLTGYTMVLPPYTGTYPPFLRKYNATDGSFVSAVSLTSGYTANEIVFSPSGNIYGATTGEGGPVALDGNGGILWTGTDQVLSLVYFQGKIVTTNSVYDAVTGQKLF